MPRGRPSWSSYIGQPPTYDSSYMSEHAERIERFRFMAESDPTNDMAWFSLGTNLHATEAWSEAAEALRKCGISTRG